MSLAHGQIKALHVAARQVGLDEADRRLIQRNIGGFYSAADKTASRQGFIAVMAFLEKRAGGQLGRADSGYWEGENKKANPTDSLIHAIRTQALAMAWTDIDVDRFLASKHLTGGAFATVAEAPAYWLGRLLDALKAIAKRRAADKSRGGRA